MCMYSTPNAINWRDTTQFHKISLLLYFFLFRITFVAQSCSKKTTRFWKWIFSFQGSLNSISFTCCEGGSPRYISGVYQHLVSAVGLGVPDVFVDPCLSAEVKLYNELLYIAALCVLFQTNDVDVILSTSLLVCQHILQYSLLLYRLTQGFFCLCVPVFQLFL